MMQVITHLRLQATTLRSACVLEALDRKYPGLTCVATINAVSGDHVLVYFDGWSHDFDYWCRHDSPELQPSGTCERIGLTLQPPSSQNDRRSTWNQSGKTMQGYARALGVTLAPENAFSPPICSETREPVLSLSERCVRRFLKALRSKALIDLGSGRSKLSTMLPFRVRQQLASARTCVWCGGPFLTGFKCVDAFTSQEWLSSSTTMPGRTATTCSQSCADALVYRHRELYDSNDSFFVYPRFFYVPRPTAAGHPSH